MHGISDLENFKISNMKISNEKERNNGFIDFDLEFTLSYKELTYKNIIMKLTYEYFSNGKTSISRNEGGLFTPFAKCIEDIKDKHPEIVESDDVLFSYTNDLDEIPSIVYQVFVPALEELGLGEDGGIYDLETDEYLMIPDEDVDEILIQSYDKAGDNLKELKQEIKRQFKEYLNL